MAVKKKATSHTLPQDSLEKSFSTGFYTPFHDLKQRLIAVNASKSPARPTPTPESAEPAQSTTVADDADLFRDAMVGVVPLDQISRRRVPLRVPSRIPARVIVSEEEEVRARLLELIQGESDFEISWSDEYVDGAMVGLSPRIISKLRLGEFSCQAYVDLHGCNRTQAHQMVTNFLRESFARNYRCVLVVSGRGRNSENRVPVLKEYLVSWLTRAPLNRLILAFATARAHDGGAGAFYVLLRRSSGKSPLVSPSGW